MHAVTDRTTKGRVYRDSMVRYSLLHPTSGYILRHLFKKQDLDLKR